MHSLSTLLIFVVIILFAIVHMQMVIAIDCGPNEVATDCAPDMSCQPSCNAPQGQPCPRECDVNLCICKEGFVRNENLECIEPTQCPLATTTVRPSNCGPNGVATGCAPDLSCQPSCAEPQGTPCPRDCELNLCICKEGFVRNENLECIEQTQCPPSTTTVRPSKCGPNEVESECALLQTCQPTCDKPDGTICPLICSRNSCVCKESYIRHSQDDLTCIEQTQCSNNETEILQCNENEEYSNCTNPCQPSCEEPNRQPCPTFTCSDSCVCKEGYFRETNNITSSCVECPTPILN